MPLPLVKSDAWGAGAVRSLTTEETVVSTRSSEVPVAAASRPPLAASSWVAGRAWGAAAAAATSTPTASPQGASLRTRPGRAFVRSSLVFMSSQCPRPDPARAPPREGDGSKGARLRRWSDGGLVGGRHDLCNAEAQDPPPTGWLC